MSGFTKREDQVYDSASRQFTLMPLSISPHGEKVTQNRAEDQSAEGQNEQL